MKDFSNPQQRKDSLDFSISPCQPKSSWRRPLHAAALIACWFSFISVPTGAAGWTNSVAATESATASEGSAKTESSSTTSPNADGLTIKLIPDQRAFLGSPDTLIDLADIFAETEIAADGQPLTMEVIRSKKDVAEAEIDGGLLRLKWGSKTAKQREVLVRASNASGEHIDTKFYVELWEPDYWKLILTVLGGLGIFLLGMKNLSEGLQAVAGNGLRRMISLVTDNRLMATGVGLLVTMLVQSSSITTVMVVGFVNSGFMTLTQAVGVIMGANIGTTITAWMASFGSNTNAKRAAYFHILFNMLGVAWITAVFPAYMLLVRGFVAGDPNADMSLSAVSAAEITAGIAAAHTGFNVTNTIVFLPLAG